MKEYLKNLTPQQLESWFNIGGIAIDKTKIKTRDWKNFKVEGDGEGGEIEYYELDIDEYPQSLYG